MKLARPILAVVTDRTLLSPNWTLAQAIAPAITGGANLIILRESDLPDTPRLSVARFVRDGVRGQVPWITSGTPEFARVAQADGVLLESVSESVAQAKDLLGEDAIVGVIASSRDAAARAAADGADFVLAVFDWVDADRVMQQVKSLASFAPVVVGLDPPLESVRCCIEAGAAGVAVCDAAMSAYNRTQALAAYRLPLAT